MSGLKVFTLICRAFKNKGGLVTVTNSVFAVSEFDNVIEGYNNLGHVKWAYLFDSYTGKIIRSYPENSLKFIKES